MSLGNILTVLVQFLVGLAVVIGAIVVGFRLVERIAINLYHYDYDYKRKWEDADGDMREHYYGNSVIFLVMAAIGLAVSWFVGRWVIRYLAGAD